MLRAITFRSQPTRTESTNEQRAQRARHAVVAYRKAADSNETDQPTLLIDLLTDLMHLAAKCRGVEFNRALDTARSHFTEEFLRAALSHTEERRAEERRAAFWQA